MMLPREMMAFNATKVAHIPLSLHSRVSYRRSTFTVQFLHEAPLRMVSIPPSFKERARLIYMEYTAEGTK
jgi:hypothetical protein